MKNINISNRHSRAGGNPANQIISCEAGRQVLSAMRNICFYWIPACAGMTQFLSADKS
ncbi:MAG: hypothetical protein WAW02_16135 [Sideroxyarcus sp.]